MKYTTLSFVEFLEFIARLADCVSIPTNDELVEAMVTEGAPKDDFSIVDYEIHLIHKHNSPRQSTTWMQRRPSHGTLTESTRPMEEKLTKFIQLFMARLAVCLKNDPLALPGTAHVVPQFVPKYLSQAQLEELSVWNPKL
eukprot:FR741025.1.p1 GENE.FR741025.1~~FR741025.1.p1  ORF type:complete len:140 (+),score=21.79 FR741025.1:97-516(+)